MHPFPSLPRQSLRCAVLLLLAACCRAEEGATAQDSHLELIHYTAPAGWQVTEQAGQSSRTLVAPGSNAGELAIIMIILSPAQENLDLRASFDAAAKQLTGERKILESSEVTTTKTRQGFDALWQTRVTQGDGDKHVHTRMIAAKVQNRMAGIYYLATSTRFYDLHQPDMDALLKSVSFKAQDAPANPVVTDEQLLIKAKERFAEGVAGRRKPHTILGDIVGVDGKPIPNVEVYRVFVWGTTIAAEKTHYGLDVDAKGHFEQQVPDGLYQMKATCIVKHAGHRVPVDLVWLDDKRAGVDQASAGGIVRDFCLAMSGLAAGEDPKRIESYFGGGFRVVGPPYNVTEGSYSTRHPGAKVQVTLTPVGPLVDGTERGAFTADMDIV